MYWGVIVAAAVGLAGGLTAWLKAEAALKRVQAHRHPVTAPGQGYTETGKAIPVLPAEQQEVTPSGTA